MSENLDLGNDLYEYLQTKADEQNTAIEDIILNLVHASGDYCNKHNELKKRQTYYPFSWICEKCKKEEDDRIDEIFKHMHVKVIT